MSIGRTAGLCLAAAAVVCAVAVPRLLSGGEAPGLPGSAAGPTAGVASGATANGAAVAAVPADPAAYVPGELIVTLADAGADGGADAVVGEARRAIEGAGYSVASTLAPASDQVGTMLLVSAGSDCMGDRLASAAESVAGARGVSAVQPNYRYSTSAATRAIDVALDEDVGQQYYLNGPDEHGANVAAAWGKVSSSSRVDVAVLDTGLYLMQEYDGNGRELVQSADNLHQEFDESNVDLAHALDYVHAADNASPLPLVNKSNPYGDDNGHGTHVSAVIAAHAKTAKTPGNLPVGIAGVSQNARIIPVKVLDAGGSGDTADFISAYSYLVAKKKGGELPNLRVVNMSLSLTFDEGVATGDEEAAPAADTSDTQIDVAYGENGDLDADTVTGDSSGTAVSSDGSSAASDATADTGLQAQIKAAEQVGIATVCAAGNEGSTARTYPSDYDECISVTALDEDGANASYSNINEFKDISAPGTGIYSAWGSQADAYATLSGTSQATAIVSGVLTLLWTNHPEWSVDDVKEAIYETARKVPGSTGSLGLRAESAAKGGSGFSALNVTEVVNGSNGAIDAAAALDYVPVPVDDDDDDDGDDDAPMALPKGAAKCAKSSYVYTGKKLAPAVAVKVDGEALVKGEDYTVAYRNNVNPGTATAVVTGKGDYAGTATCTFKIVLGTTKVKKLQAGKKSFTAHWARQKSGNVGYQVRYSLKSNMKGAKSKLVAKNKTTKLKVAKLRPGRKYHVQVRTYKKIGKKKYYSAWSAKRSVKVR